MKFHVKYHILFGLLALLQLGCTLGKGLEKDQALLLQVKVENLIEKILRVIQDYYSQIRTELKCIPDHVPDTIIGTLKTSIDCVEQNERNFGNGRISSNTHKKLFLRCFSDAKKEVQETIMGINPQLDYCPENMTEKTYQINVSTVFTKTFHINIKNGLEVIRKKVHLGKEKEVYVLNQGGKIYDKQNQTNSGNGSADSLLDEQGSGFHPKEHGPDYDSSYDDKDDGNSLNDEDEFGPEPHLHVDDYVDYDEGNHQNGDVNGVNEDEHLYSKEHDGKGHPSKEHNHGTDDFSAPNSGHQVSNFPNAGEDVNSENGLESIEDHVKELESEAHHVISPDSKHQGKGHNSKEHGSQSVDPGISHNSKEHLDKGQDSKKQHEKGHDSKEHHDKGHGSKEHYDEGHESKEHHDKGHGSKEHYDEGHESKEHHDKGHESKEHHDKGHESKEHNDKGHESKEHPVKGHSSKEHHTVGPQLGDMSEGHYTVEQPEKGSQAGQQNDKGIHSVHHQQSQINHVGIGITTHDSTKGDVNHTVLLNDTNIATPETKFTTELPAEDDIELDTTEDAFEQDYYTDMDVELDDANYENEYYDTTQKEKDFIQTDSPDEAEDGEEKEDLLMKPTANYNSRRIQIKPKNHIKLKSKKPQSGERHRIKLPKTPPRKQQQTTPKHRAVSSLSQNFSANDF